MEANLTEPDGPTQPGVTRSTPATFAVLRFAKKFGSAEHKLPVPRLSWCTPRMMRPGRASASASNRDHQTLFRGVR